jgi:hypothetical protein
MPRSTHLRAAVATAFLLLGATTLFSTTANASSRTRPTTTKPPATTQPPGTTQPPVVVAPPGPATGFAVVQNIPDDFQVQMTSATELGQAELLSGPTTIGPAIVLVGSGGRVGFLRLVENSDYVFRYRNALPSGPNLVVGAWVQFSFRTPTFDSLRPAAPQNLRVVERTASTVTVRWDAVPNAIGYSFSVNGGAFTSTTTVTCIYCTPIDPLTAVIARPAVGTPATVRVIATRPPTQPFLCTAYCFPDSRFVDSLPVTLVVANS